jgi:hypothetical protein
MAPAVDEARSARTGSTGDAWALRKAARLSEGAVVTEGPPLCVARDGRAHGRRQLRTTPSALSITSTTRASSEKATSGPGTLRKALARLAWLSESSGGRCDGTPVHRADF